MAQPWRAAPDRCPRCKKRWYAGLPGPEDEAERQRRLARERERGLYWTGSCIVTGRCPECGVGLAHGGGDDPQS